MMKEIKQDHREIMYDSETINLSGITDCDKRRMPLIRLNMVRACCVSCSVYAVVCTALV